MDNDPCLILWSSLANSCNEEESWPPFFSLLLNSKQGIIFQFILKLPYIDEELVGWTKRKDPGFKPLCHRLHNYATVNCSRNSRIPSEWSSSPWNSVLLGWSLFKDDDRDWSNEELRQHKIPSRKSSPILPVLEEQLWIELPKRSSALDDLLWKGNVELQDAIAFAFEKNAPVMSKFQASL